MSDTNQADIQTAAKALWPFVRHIPNCGGDPDATAAVIALGTAIGEIGPNASEQQAYDAGFLAGQQDIAAYLQENAHRLGIGNRHTQRLMEMLTERLESYDA